MDVYVFIAGERSRGSEQNGQRCAGDGDGAVDLQGRGGGARAPTGQHGRPAGCSQERHRRQSRTAPTAHRKCRPNRYEKQNNAPALRCSRMDKLLQAATAL